MDSGPLGLFQQLPMGIILMFCGSSILLVIVIAYIVRARGIKARAAVPAMAGVAMASSYDSGSTDLPDLDSFGSADPVKAAPTPTNGAYTVHLAEGEMVEAVEVLTILRDVAEGGLIIRIGDKAYRNPPGIADAEFKRRFHSTLRDLNGAQTPVEVKSAAPAVAMPPPPPAPASAAPPADDAAPVSEDALDEPTFDLPPISPPPPRVTGTFAPAPGDLPKFKMPDGPPVKPKRGQRPVAEPIPEINIAASIEAYLQHKLSQTPQYAMRSIHVRPAMHGAIAIEVDGQFYDSVGEVADAAVRQFLSSTIEEWQSRQ
ncbi:MAG: hypothetical protein GC204_05460 [Chloroflexi bacterium]|nr:hypothetical protein [Chloroflexota bacterium]